MTGHGYPLWLNRQTHPERRETVTRLKDCNAIQEVVELLAHDGFDSLGEAIRRIINEAMRLERQNHLGVGPYERSEHRRGQANGYKSKTVQTRVGALDLDVPQVRDSSFYPSSLEKGLRSERALKIALAEMYIQGVSTRKVAKITEQLCGFEVTSTQVSRAAKDLDGVLEQWRNRPLGAYPYVYLDARYEKVRHNGSVIGMAVLVAVGISTTGHRKVLGSSVSLSPLAGVPAPFATARLARCQIVYQRCPRRLESGQDSCFPECPLAALSVSSSTECSSVCAQANDEKRGGSLYPQYLHRTE